MIHIKNNILVFQGQIGVDMRQSQVLIIMSEQNTTIIIDLIFMREQLIINLSLFPIQFVQQIQKLSMYTLLYYNVVIFHGHFWC